MVAWRLPTVKPRSTTRLSSPLPMVAASAWQSMSLRWPFGPVTEMRNMRFASIHDAFVAQVALEAVAQVARLVEALAVLRRRRIGHRRGHEDHQVGPAAA